jgi:taurine dioxygenase
MATIAKPAASADLPVLDMRRVAGRIGAEIRGIDLAGDLSDATIAAIRAAMLEHKVIFFRGQHDLDDAGQEAFAERLGEPQVYPDLPARPGTRSILELDSLTGGIANSWHTDLTYVECPPAITILRGVIVPETGGDTMWANGASAYLDLPQNLRDFADRLWTIHSNQYDHIASTERRLRVVSPGQQGKASAQAIKLSRVIEAEQPLVRVHPETGERSLLVGRYAKLILGLRPEDASFLIPMFQDYATRPENLVRWSWAQGDVAVWDNRSTQHRVLADFGEDRRLMRRVTLSGTRLVGTDGREGRAIGGEAQA